MKTILASLAGIVALGASILTAPACAAGNAPLRKAPELSINVPGKGQQLLSQYRGKVVALGFIFTTCPHCAAFSKVKTKMQEEYAARGLQVIDVAVDANADLRVDGFIKDNHVGYPVGWIGQAQMVSFMNWGSERFVVPQLILIDRKGVIHYQTPPSEDDDWDKLMAEPAIRQHIEELLGHAASSTSTHHTGAARPVAAKPGA